MEVPVLFLVYNRPSTTKIVFEKIREIEPNKFYIAADGPSEKILSDRRKCNEVREIVTDVDWNSTVEILFRDDNLGCRTAVSSAIDWFFEQEEMGIILEDDCLPTKSFFKFCEIMLEKYKEDARIMHINGNNFGVELKKFQNSDISYYFSNFAQAWGWATWRRAWEKYDINIDKFKKMVSNNSDYIDNLFSASKYKEKTIERWKKVYKGEIDTWDYQWQFALITNHGLSIVPKINQISNIGFGEFATHTLNENSRKSMLKTEEIKFPLVEPDFTIPNKRIDEWFEQNMLGKAPILSRLKQKLSNLSSK